MVLGAFYAVATNTPPMTFSAVVAYIWLGQCLFALIPYNIDPELRTMFQSGSVAYEILRPLNLYGFWFARTLAFRTAPTLLRLIPGLFFAFVVLRLIGLDDWAIPLPPSMVHAASFFLSLFAMVLLACAFQMITNVCMFWLIDSRGMVNLTTGFVYVFSGMIIPLPLFPDWMQPVLRWQPFRGLCDVPFRIYSGDIPIGELPLEIALQFAWVLLLIAIGVVFLSRAQHRLVVQGG